MRQDDATRLVHGLRRQKVVGAVARLTDVHATLQQRVGHGPRTRVAAADDGDQACGCIHGMSEVRVLGSWFFVDSACIRIYFVTSVVNAISNSANRI